MLEETVYGYDPKKRFHQLSHTLENIWRVMDKVFIKPDDARRAELCIADYVVLDALMKLDNLDENVLQELVNCVPADLMSPPAREFAVALMRYDNDSGELLASQAVLWDLEKKSEKSKSGIFDRHARRPVLMLAAELRNHNATVGTH